MANGTVKLTRTPGATGNRKTYTLSYWIKRGDLTEIQQIWNVYSAGSDYMYMRFIASGALYLESYTGGASNIGFTTNRLFRDPGAWYHIVLAVDTAQSVSTDRWKLYVNGVQETSFSSSSYSTEDVLTSANTDTFPLYIGANQDTDQGFSGVMAHVHLTDGTAYAPTAFGEFDTTSGIWVAKTGPSVTYGTNGFFLKFASGALGTDSSGEGNNMTVSGTMTNTKDTPDNNFCLPNDLSKGSTVALSNGNTTIAKDSGWLSCMGNFGMDTGKWYWEQKVAAVGNANAGITMSKQDGTSHSSVDATRIMYGSDGNVYNEQGSTTATGTTFTTGDIISVALDCAGDTIKFYKNDVLIHTETETDISDNEWCPAWGMSSGTWDTNFGNGYFATTAVTSAVADGNGEGQFEYAPPSGYLALCTNNLGSDS